MPLVSLLSESDDPRRPQARLNALNDILQIPAGCIPDTRGPPTLAAPTVGRSAYAGPSCQRKSLEYAPTRRSGAVPARVRAPMACPVPAHSASQLHTIVARFLRRWRIEAAFQTVRIHLGGETQHQGAVPAIALNHPRPAGTLQLGRPDRTRATAGPAPAAAPNHLGTLRTHGHGCPSPRANHPPNRRTPLCAVPPTCRHRRHCSRNASGPSATAPPEHNRNRDAAVIPRSPGLPPAWTDRIAFQSPVKAATRFCSQRFPTCYLRTVNSVTINVPVLTAVAFK